MQVCFDLTLNRFFLCPPLRPRVLALASLPWLGLGGAPFVFPPLFFPFFGPLLVKVFTLVQTASARAAVGTHFGSSRCGLIVQVAKLRCGISRPTRGWKTLAQNRTLPSVTPPTQISINYLGVVAERVDPAQEPLRVWTLYNDKLPQLLTRSTC